MLNINFGKCVTGNDLESDLFIFQHILRSPSSDYESLRAAIHAIQQSTRRITDAGAVAFIFAAEFEHSQKCSTLSGLFVSVKMCNSMGILLNVEIFFFCSHDPFFPTVFNTKATA